jgi:hypothetical protein
MILPGPIQPSKSTPPPCSDFTVGSSNNTNRSSIDSDGTAITVATTAKDESSKGDVNTKSCDSDEGLAIPPVKPDFLSASETAIAESAKRRNSCYRHLQSRHLLPRYLRLAMDRDPSNRDHDHEYDHAPPCLTYSNDMGLLVSTSTSSGCFARSTSTNDRPCPGDCSDNAGIDRIDEVDAAIASEKAVDKAEAKTKPRGLFAPFRSSPLYHDKDDDLLNPSTGNVDVHSNKQDTATATAGPISSPRKDGRCLHSCAMS